MILNKLKPYRILSLIFISVICAVSCSNDGLTEMNDPDIIVPNPITLTTRLIINEATGEGIRFEDRDSIYLIGSSRTAIYVNYSGAWISDNPLRWSEEETDSNNQYSFQCRFTGKTIGDTNQAPISLYAYSPGINKYESINLVFEHTEARVLIAVGLVDPSIVWNGHCEIYFNTIYTGISTSVNSKGEMVFHEIGRESVRERV